MRVGDEEVREQLSVERFNVTDNLTAEIVDVAESLAGSTAVGRGRTETVPSSGSSPETGCVGLPSDNRIS